MSSFKSLIFESLKFRFVTLERSIIRMINLSRTELYLPLFSVGKYVCLSTNKTKTKSMLLFGNQKDYLKLNFTRYIMLYALH